MTQEEWDGLLIECFHSRPDVQMWRLYWDFDEIKGLKRIHKPWMYRMTVVRFICDCLPKLAGVLWKTKLKDKYRIVRTLAKGNMDITPGATYHREIQGFRYDRLRDDATHTRQKLTQDALKRVYRVDGKTVK